MAMHIAEARVAERLTYDKMSADLGIPAGRLNRVCVGASRPTPSERDRLAKYFEMDLSYGRPPKSCLGRKGSFRRSDTHTADHHQNGVQAAPSSPVSVAKHQTYTLQVTAPVAAVGDLVAFTICGQTFYGRVAPGEPATLFPAVAAAELAGLASIP